MSELNDLDKARKVDFQQVQSDIYDALTQYEGLNPIIISGFIMDAVMDSGIIDEEYLATWRKLKDTKR